MGTAGANVARWFLFFDGRAGIAYDDAGSPIGLDGVFFRDTDADAHSADMNTGVPPGNAPE
jgi:hypothetical protein